MKYIKITNTAESVPRLYLEVLGVSTKADNNETIGQFGSGSKFAPIFALRRNWEWINVGNDANGSYTMSYKIVRDENSDIDIVNFDYKDEYLKPSSFSINAGAIGWQNPFMVFREAFANAIDAHLEFGEDYSIEIVNEVGEPVEGKFSVYLTAAPELLEIVYNFDKYFSFNREPIFTSNKGGKIYHKLDNDDKNLRIYHKGVLVYGLELLSGDVSEHDEDDIFYSLFDYDLPYVEMGEDRRLVNPLNTELRQVCNMFLHNAHYNSDFSKNVIQYIIETKGFTSKFNMNYVDRERFDSLNYFCNSDPDITDIYEWGNNNYFTVYPWSYSNDDLIEVDIDKEDEYPEGEMPNSFALEFYKTLKDKYIDDDQDEDGLYRICFVNEDINNDLGQDLFTALTEIGALPIVVSGAVANLIEHSGGKNYLNKNMLSEKINYPIKEVTGVAKKIFDYALNIVSDYDPRIKKVKVEVMRTTEKNANIRGKAINLDAMTRLSISRRDLFDPEDLEDYIDQLDDEFKPTILINESIIKEDEINALIATLIHELDHHISGAGDYSREFRDVADTRIGDLVSQRYQVFYENQKKEIDEEVAKSREEV